MVSQGFAATHISGIIALGGELLRSPADINNPFLRYYRHLYSSRVVIQ